MSNIFTKPKNSTYINQNSSVAPKNVEAKDNLYVNSFYDDPKEALRDDNNVFTKSKEALYINSYTGGRTDTAVVTISKDNIIYVNIDNEYVYKESYLEDHVFYC